MISTQQKKKWKGKRVATGKTCQTPSLWLKNLKEYITIHLLLVVCLLLHVFFFFSGQQDWKLVNHLQLIFINCLLAKQIVTTGFWLYLFHDKLHIIIIHINLL
jgi:hypothetical protein